MAEQPRFDVFGREGPLEERIVEQVDLADGEVVGRPPVAVDQVELLRGERTGDGMLGHSYLLGWIFAAEG
jgi:hypothetical protein